MPRSRLPAPGSRASFSSIAEALRAHAHVPGPPWLALPQSLPSVQMSLLYFGSRLLKQAAQPPARVGGRFAESARSQRAKTIRPITADLPLRRAVALDEHRSPHHARFP